MTNAGLSYVCNEAENNFKSISQSEKCFSCYGHFNYKKLNKTFYGPAALTIASLIEDKIC